MKSIILESYNPNLIRAMRALKIVEKPVPVPEHGEVLVKIEYAPVNPSDIAFIRGGYNIQKALPATPGFEATGIVEKTGPRVDTLLTGKRLAFFYQSEAGGTWAEYVSVKVENTVTVHQDMQVEQAACLFINPFTARAMFRQVEQAGAKAIIQSAAAGQVGRIISYLASQSGIALINLVRKDEQVSELKKAGDTHVLNIQADDFAANLKKLAHDLKATVALDAVGGDLTGILLNAMPPKGKVILYGGLSGMAIGQIDPMGIIFKGKHLEGFNLRDGMAGVSREELLIESDHIQQLFIQGKLKTSIRGIFPIDDFYSGLRTYISNMSAGKVLIKM